MNHNIQDCNCIVHYNFGYNIDHHSDMDYLSMDYKVNYMVLIFIYLFLDKKIQIFS